MQPEQLNKIFELCGSPDEVIWPGVSKMPGYNNLKPSRPMKRRVREVFRQCVKKDLPFTSSVLSLFFNHKTMELCVCMKLYLDESLFAFTVLTAML